MESRNPFYAAIGDLRGPVEKRKGCLINGAPDRMSFIISPASPPGPAQPSPSKHCKKKKKKRERKSPQSRPSFNPKNPRRPRPVKDQKLYMVFYRCRNLAPRVRTATGRAGSTFSRPEDLSGGPLPPCFPWVTVDTHILPHYTPQSRPPVKSANFRPMTCSEGRD